MLGDVLLDQPVLELLDALRAVNASGRTTRELRDQRGRYTLDLPPGITVFAPVDGHPRHPEQPRGVVGDKRVVRLRERDSGLVQSAGVERAPAPILALHLVRHHYVCMQLRVSGSGIVVIKRRGDHAHDRHLRDTTRADAGYGDPLFQQSDRVAHRSVMRPRNQRLRARISDAPDRADRLGRGERQVETCNGSARLLRNLFLTDALHHLFPRLATQAGIEACNAGRNPLAWGLQRGEPLAELLTGDRVGAVTEQSGQVFISHRVALGQRGAAPVVETHQTGADPRSGRAAGLGVVPGQRAAHLPVAVTNDDRFQQVLVALAGRHDPDGHHHDAPSPRPSQEGRSRESGACAARGPHS